MSKIQNDPALGLNAAIAAALNGERAAAKVTFDELAETTGISKRTLMRLLSTTERHIDVQALNAISSALNLSVGEVVTMAEARLERAERLSRSGLSAVADRPDLAAAADDQGQSAARESEGYNEP